MHEFPTQADDVSFAKGNRRSGFTLVELLVVIGILVVLIGILLPVVNRARQSAISTQCQTNMKSLAAAYTAYYLDHDGLLLTCAESAGGSPGAGTTQIGAGILWVPSGTQNTVEKKLATGAIVPYLSTNGKSLSSLFRCPAMRTPEDLAGYGTAAVYPFTYSMNAFSAPPAGGSYKQHYGNDPPLGPWRIGKILSPATHILLYDNDQFGTDDKFWYANPTDSLGDRHGTAVPQLFYNALDGKMDPVTRGQGNVAFFDGHVELVTNDACHDATKNDPLVK